MIKVNSRIDFLKEVLKHLPDNNVCAEVGVFRGAFSKDILDVLKPKTLHLIDPWEIGEDKNGVGGYPESFGTTSYATDQYFNEVITIFDKEINSGQVVMNRKYSYDAVSLFPDEYFDFIYLDGCHLYESVKADLQDYLPKLKKTGLMCGHDYFESDIFGVVRAVNEFIKANSFEFLILSENGQDCHDWALKPAL